MVNAVEGPAEMIIGGRYRVIRALATGGMGSVFEAENVRTRRRVAIKTIRPEVAQRVSIVQRFEREARAAGQLRHPNIVDVLDLGDDSGQQLLFLVEEYLVGGDLGSCLRAVGTLGPRAALATLLPIMDALSVAHAHGVVHRDLKPDNIFLHETPQGVVPKLIDFGIAKLLEDSLGSPQRSTISLVGSPLYMSPEQASADGSIDARADVWSMGVVFYEALTGRTPYEGQSAFSLFSKIAADEPVALATIAPDLPGDLVAAVQRAVTRDRDERWPTMAAFASALRSCEAWRDVDPSEVNRWIVNVEGTSRGLGGFSVGVFNLAARTTLDLSDEGPSIEVEPSAHPSGLWTGEVSTGITAAAPLSPRRVRMTVAAGILSAVLGGVVMNGRHSNDPLGAASVRAPPRVDASTPASHPREVPAPAQVAVTAPDASASRSSLVRRAPPRPVPSRPAAAGLRRASSDPPVTLGFNGAPIVE